MSVDHPSIDSTIELAARLHRGQVDKAGAPYIAHPLAVMRMVPERSWHVGAMHDTLEQCGVTPGYLRAWGYSEEEIAALELLTRRRAKDGDVCDSCAHEHTAGAVRPCLVINCECPFARDETYAAYIERIATSGNQMAIEVKIADLNDNLGHPHRPLIASSLGKRYRDSRRRLYEVAEIQTPEPITE